MILAGDIGGTKTNLGFFEREGGQLQCVVSQQYPSRSAASLDELCRQFLSEHDAQAEAACFGVAGPCRKGVCTAMNLPWRVDGQQLGQMLGIDHTSVINDLQATAYGILVLPEEDFAVIQQGDPDAKGNAAVIAAGTGLGEAGLYWDGSTYQPVASEGGHCDFAAKDELEIELLQFLRKQFAHVAWERILSGPGLVHLYEFFKARGDASPAPDVAEEIRSKDPGAAITQAALSDRCPVCRQALELFSAIYGAEAGNLGLQMMATGGVYLGGGIAPRIRSMLDTDAFREAFVAKGRLRSLLEAIPVRIVMTDQAALWGAANCARLASDARSAG